MTMYKYQVRTTTNGDTSEVIGDKVQEYEGIKFFVARSLDNANRFTGTELTTGLKIFGYGASRLETLEQTKKTIDRVGAEKTLKAIKDLTEKYEYPELNTTVVKADVMYLQSNKSQKVIKSYENKAGYYPITEDEYLRLKDVKDRYIRHTPTGAYYHIPADRLDMLEKITTDYTESTKKDFDLYEYGLAKYRMQRYIDGQEVSSIVDILTSNDNKHSIKAFSEITGVALLPAQGKRLREVKSYLQRNMNNAYYDWEDRIASQK